MATSLLTSLTSCFCIDNRYNGSNEDGFFSREELENGEGSDSEESLDGESFSWTGITLQRGLITSQDDFMPWLLDPNYAQVGPMKMNCLQGVIHYISQYDGGLLAEKIRTKYSKLKKRHIHEVAKTALYKRLFVFVGLEKADGPFRMDKVDAIWKTAMIQPGSVISFGDDRGNVHVAIVTKSKKIRSLYLNLEDGTKRSFGKYHYKKVFDEIQYIIKSFSPEEKKREGIAEVFYVSHSFCSLFETGSSL